MQKKSQYPSRRELEQRIRNSNSYERESLLQLAHYLEQERLWAKPTSAKRQRSATRKSR